jgi:hypothetical protein
MQPADRKQFAEALIGFAEIKGRQLSAPALELYWRAMQHWAIADFLAAAAVLLRQCEFFPTPADFERLRRAAAGLGADSAWEQLICDHGRCDDPVGARALRSLGGWAVIGFADTDRLPWLKERFREAYENFQDSEIAEAGLPDPELLSCSASPLLVGHAGR